MAELFEATEIREVFVHGDGPSHMSKVSGLKVLIGVIGFYILFQIGCYHDRYTEREMTWECNPVPLMPYHVYEKGTLRLRFKDNPAHFEHISGPTADQLCETLPRSGKKAIQVRFRVRGSYFHGYVGHDIEEIDGTKKNPIGERGTSGSQELINTPSPLSSTFRRHLFWKR